MIIYLDFTIGLRIADQGELIVNTKFGAKFFESGIVELSIIVNDNDLRNSKLIDNKLPNEASYVFRSDPS